LSIEEVETNLDSFFYDDVSKMLYVHTSDSQSPEGRALTASIAEGDGLNLTPVSDGGNVSNVIVEGLNFTGFQSRECPKGAGRNRWGINILKADHVFVRNCHSFLNNGGIFLMGAKDSVVEDCTAFANYSRFLDLGNQILGWNPTNVVFRRNKAEGYGQGNGSDITLYSSVINPLMEDNLVINGGIMVKGFSDDYKVLGKDGIKRQLSEGELQNIQIRNKCVGNNAYYYYKPNETNILVKDYTNFDAKKTYADPINYDFREQVCGEVFYVSPMGDDNSDGTTRLKAWKTLTHASKMISPGQTLYIMAGEYKECIQPAKSGEENAPIRFVRYGNDRVVIEGNNKLEAGVNLVDKSNIEIEGLWIKNFKKSGISALSGKNLSVRYCITSNCPTGLTAKNIDNFKIYNNLFIDYKLAAIYLENTLKSTLLSNIIDKGSGAGILLDDSSANDLWSDYNIFNTTLIAKIDNNPFDTIDKWRSARGVDGNSNCHAPEFTNTSEDFSLPSTSKLVGAGQNADIIGPFLRIPTKLPISVKNPKIHSVTASTANIECWTPEANALATISWGLTPTCENTLTTEEPSIFHTASIVGLKPDTNYFYRVQAKTNEKNFRIAAFSDKTKEADNSFAEPPANEFKTTVSDQPGRIFYVSLTGDNKESGTSPEKAWKSINYAASQVVSGDTVIIQPGRYEELVIVRGTGEKDRPITFKAAKGGGQVWMDGSNRGRSTAFKISNKHYINLDGFYFSHFNYVAHGGDAINLLSGSNHRIQRCFYDGRIRGSGYSACFLRAEKITNLVVENCVMIGGMGQGMTLSRCPNTTIRNCVFYNNNLRAFTAFLWNPSDRLTVSHNLVCDSMPGKTYNALFRVMDIENLNSNHNAYFIRTKPEDHYIVEALKIDGKEPKQGSSFYLQADEIRSRHGQDKDSIFGNPGIKVVDTLVSNDLAKSDYNAANKLWFKNEMHHNDTEFLPLDFGDFIIPLDNPLSKASDGNPVGLNPAAFPEYKAASEDINTPIATGKP